MRGDQPSGDPVIHEVRRVHDGPRPMETFRLTPPEGTEQSRDVVRAGKVAAVIAYDPAADALVMLRQFRLPAHLANGHGDLVEIVAGRVEAGEDIMEAARRECVEEIGAAPGELVELFRYLPSPGYTDEETTVFLGRVDARDVPEAAGALEEGESTRPFVVPRAEAVAALDGGDVRNGLTLIALGWVALNGERMAGMLV